MEMLLNPLVLLVNFILVPGLAYGSQLALGALGVTMVYAVLNFSNFSHGEVMSFGAMVTILATYWLQSIGLSISPLPTALLALPVGILGSIGLCLLLDRLVFRFYRHQRASSVTYLIVSIGVMFVIGGLIRFIIGPDDQNFNDGDRFLLKAREFKEMSGLSEGLAIKSSQAITVITAFTAALAAVAGSLYGLDKSYKPLVYLHLVLPIFAAAIVGGVGNPLGAIVGGFVIAFSELLLTFAYKKVAAYLFGHGFFGDGLLQILSTDYKFAVSFMILVVVLLVKPTGIFSGKSL